MPHPIQAVGTHAGRRHASTPPGVATTPHHHSVGPPPHSHRCPSRRSPPPRHPVCSGSSAAACLAWGASWPWQLLEWLGACLPCLVDESSNRVVVFLDGAENMHDIILDGSFMLLVTQHNELTTIFVDP